MAVCFGFVFRYTPFASSSWTLGLSTIGTLILITGAIALGVNLLGIGSRCMCTGRRNGPCFLKFHCWLLILLAMMLFGVGIFILVESGARFNNAGTVWNSLSDNEQVAIEATRQCCGWISIKESPQCRWQDKGPCGPSIANKQKEILVALGAIYSSMAVAQLLLFGITNSLAGALRQKGREQKALEEARSLRRNSRFSEKGTTPAAIK